jgi:hypothetical protein
VPIRSPRGRAAAYRAVWQWPLRSPARLAVTAAVVLAVVVGVSTALTALNPPTPDGATSATGSDPVGTGTPRAAQPTTRGTRTPTPTALPPVPELTPSPRPLSSAPGVALQVASTWSAAWVRPPEGTTAEQWLEGLRPTTTQEYLGVLATVDPAVIPATRVTGEPRPVSVAVNTVEVEVPTDALTLLVLVVRTEAGDWRVSGYDRI